MNSRKPLEKEIQKAIIDVLELSGFLVVKVNNVGIYKKSSDSYIPPRQKGVCDLLCCHKGRFYAIEVKTPTGTLTPHQEAFLTSVKKAGGEAMVMKSVDDALSLVEAVKHTWSV